MHPEVKRVAEQHVAQRTHFDADVLYNHFLDQVWEQAKLEPVANAFGVQQHGIVEIGHSLIVRLASMQEARHVSHLFVLLCTQDQRRKSANLRGEVFLVDHVKASHKVRVLLVGPLDVAQNLLGVRSADDLVACQNQHHTEVRVLGFNLVSDLLDDAKLINDVDCLAVVVKETSSSVAEFDDENVLLGARFESASEENLEELHVLAQIAHS